MTIWRTVFVVLAFLVALVVPSTSRAQSQYVTIYSDQRMECLDFAAGDLSDAVTLQMWPCGGYNQMNQHWRVIKVSDNTYFFQNWLNGTCVSLEGDSVANGVRLVQRTCDASNPSQLWYMATRDYLGQKSKWINARSNRCMDIPNGSRQFQQWDCATANYWGPQMFRMSFDATEPARL